MRFDWSYPELEVLRENVLKRTPFKFQDQFNQLLSNDIHRIGVKQTWKYDLLTCMFEVPGDIVVSVPSVPASISPIIWNKKRSVKYTNTIVPRKRILQLRNAFLRKRFHQCWNIRLLNPTYIVKEVFNNKDSNIATPEERLEILPKLLFEIKRGNFKTVYLISKPEFDRKDYFTFSKNWKIEIEVTDNHVVPDNEFFKMSDHTQRKNEKQIEQLAKTLGAKEYNKNTFEELSQEGVFYNKSKETIIQILQSAKKYWEKFKTGDNEKYAKITEDIIDAITNEKEYASGRRFKISSSIDFNVERKDQELLYEALNGICDEIQSDHKLFKNPKIVDEHAYKIDNLFFDEYNQTIYFKEKKVMKGPAKFHIVKYLAENLGQPISKYEIACYYHSKTQPHYKDAQKHDPEYKKLKTNICNINKDFKKNKCHYKIDSKNKKSALIKLDD